MSVSKNACAQLLRHSCDSMKIFMILTSTSHVTYAMCASHFRFNTTFIIFL